ncbi:hypothetical protein F5Y03DRAFT_408665 [Xylaria venustula]|nr:hypothetical protein F5Y03DRAFT_408665 [Xylaria venustula]
MSTFLFRSRGPATNSQTHSGGGTVEVAFPNKHDIHPPWETRGLTTEHLIHAAWALLLRRYIGCDKIAFGVVSLEAEVETTCFSCLMVESKSISDYLRDLKSCYHSSGTGFSQNVSTASINTAVCYRHRDKKLPLRSNLAFLVDADFHRETPKLNLVYSAEIEARVAENVASTLAKALTEILAFDALSPITVDEIDILSERDEGFLLGHNRQYPSAIESCVHDMIATQARCTPQAEAIYSWDGSLTYLELEDISTRLALFLAFAPLDGDYPTERLALIVDIADISLILAAPQYEARLNGLVSAVVCIPTSKALLSDMLPPVELDDQAPSASKATPDNAAFILFTSGSTGKPKAVVQPHGAICTLFQSHSKSLHLDSCCRVFQFAAYTFDVSTMDIFTTLMQGGCLCIPSEADRRSNMAGFINRAKVNWADLTATVANLLYPHEVPTLKTLVLAGEAVQDEHLERWFGHVRLINCYGPVESGNCTAYEFRSRHEKLAATIGYAMEGARCWIVAPHNPHRLASVGEVGEILVEGPTLSRGYLKDTCRTEAAFVQDLEWNGRFGYNTHRTIMRRFYRTGDMAYMDPDGMFVFVGRADQQVKVHGQRIELMEIEHHLTTNIPSLISRAVVAYPRSGPFADHLVGVLQLAPILAIGCAPRDGALGLFHPLDAPEIYLMLRSKLPGYAVPSFLLSIDRIPLTNSGKSDRRRIHDQLCSLPREVRLSSFGTLDVSSLAPHETIAVAISTFLADLFQLHAIRKRDVLIDKLGISSIQAMTLLSWLKSQYGGHVSIEILNKDGMSVRSLAQQVRLAAKGNIAPAPGIDLVKEVKHITDSLLLKLRHNTRPALSYASYDTVSSKGVLLTGATGYLGIEVLRQLLTQPTVRLIHVLVKTSSQQDGIDRLRQAIAATGHKWESAWEARLIVWPGNLSQRQLGLSRQHWEHLTDGTIDTIIHNGASVRYNLCYEKLKSVNVDATVEILHALLASPCAMNLVYVSGGQRLSPVEELSDAVRVKEAAKSTGYSQTKLVSELVVSRLSEKFAKARGHSLHIIRPGYIIGSRSIGFANTRDYIWRLVAGAVGAGIRSSGREDEWMFVCDVEQVAQRILGSSGLIIMTDDESLNSVTTIMDGIYLTDMWELLCQELQCTLEPLASAEWWRRLRCLVEQKGEGHPLWPLYFLLDQERGTFTCYWKSTTSDANKSLVTKALRKNISYLKRIGFFSV